MKFKQSERFMAEAVAALLGIQQAIRRERKKGEALEQAIDLFLGTTFGAFQRKEGSDQFEVLSVQHRKQLEGNVGSSEEVIKAYGFDLEVGEEQAKELDSLLSTFTESDRDKKHFERNRFEAMISAAVAPEHIALTGTPPTDQEMAEDFFKTAQRNMKSQCISLKGASGGPGFGSILTPTTDIVYFVSTQTTFGSYLAEGVDPCTWFQTSKLAPSTLKLEWKSIISEHWDSFMEFACALLLQFELTFGSYERIKICPVCKALYFEERKDEKKYCNENCGSKWKSKNDQKIPCRKRQRTHFENMYNSLANGQCKKPRYPDADYCRECDMDTSQIKGGQCKKLNEENAALIQQKKAQKLRKKQAACFQFNRSYRDEMGGRLLDLPLFNEGLCKGCELPAQSKRIYCPTLIDGAIKLNPSWKPPRTYKRK